MKFNRLSFFISTTFLLLGCGCQDKNAQKRVEENGDVILCVPNGVKGV